MKFLKLLVPALSLVAMTYTAQAFADPVTIADITGSLSAANTKELGRISRSGVPSDFGTVKAFPGLINTGTSYSYTTYTFASSLFAGGQNVEVQFYDLNSTASLFAAAFAGTYNPSSPGTTYLGDLGSSPDAFGTNAGFFNFVLAPNTDLVILVNETLGGANSSAEFGVPFELVVQHSTNDADGQYGDPVIVATPEPSSLVLLGTGVLGMIGVARRRFAV